MSNNQNHHRFKSDFFTFADGSGAEVSREGDG